MSIKSTKLIFGAAIVALLSSCGSTLEVTTTWDVNAEDQDAIKAYDEFTKGTLDLANLKVVYRGSDFTYEETIVGDSAYTVHTDGDSITYTWCWLENSTYYTAWRYNNDAIGEYAVDKVSYDWSYRTYSVYFRTFDSADITARHFSHKGKKVMKGNEVISVEGTMIYKVTHEDGAYDLVEAVTDGDFMLTAHWKAYDAGETEPWADISFTFTHSGEFRFDKPNIEGWELWK